MEHLNIDEIEAQEVNENSGQFVIIVGQVGSGKSTMGSTFPKALSLDLEGTASNIKGIKRISIKRGSKKTKVTKKDDKGKLITSVEDTRALPFTRMLDFGKQFLESNKYETLVIDGGTEYVQYIQDYTTQVLGREEFSVAHAKFGDLWVKSRETMLGFIKMLIGNGKNVVLITHIEEVVEIDPSTDEEITSYRPMIPDKQCVNKIPALANIVGMVNVDKKGVRSFNCTQTSKNVLKNQFGITSPIEPTYEALVEKIKEFYSESK